MTAGSVRNISQNKSGDIVATVQRDTASTVAVRGLPSMAANSPNISPALMSRNVTCLPFSENIVAWAFPAVRNNTVRVSS